MALLGHDSLEDVAKNDPIVKEKVGIVANDRLHKIIAMEEEIVMLKTKIDMLEKEKKALTDNSIWLSQKHAEYMGILELIKAIGLKASLGPQR